jgi:hypothetical protein
MNAEVEVEATAECGLVLQQAGQSILREVRVKNTGEETLVGMTLTVSSDIGLFRPLAMALGAVQPGETVSVPIPEGEPRLDYGFLSTLADVKEGEVRVALTDEWQEVTGECLVSPDAASLDFVIFSWRNGDASFEIADFTIINE